MGQKCPYLAKNASFWPNLAVFCPISSHARWHLRHIRHQNTKTSLYKLSKMVGFVHFSNFFIPSEKYYNLQSCWITLYLNTTESIFPWLIFYVYMIMMAFTNIWIDTKHTSICSKVITKYRHTIKVTLNTVDGINNPHEWPYFIALRELHSYNL